MIEAHTNHFALRLTPHYLPLPPGVPLSVAESLFPEWRALMHLAGAKRDTKPINRDLREYAFDIDKWRSRVQHWTLLLKAEKVEDTPLEGHYERIEPCRI